ncbi:MAG: transcriptional coactivator p15/PC4 family protein [Desulfobaccales bacterium]
MTNKPVCEIQKNSRETIRFRLAEFKGHKFIDLRVYAKEDGKDPAPTKKGLAVSPTLWPQFRAALAQTEAAMIEAGWIDREDLG